MKRFKHYILAMLFATTVGGAAMATVPSTAQAAACDTGRFLTFPTWYRGLEKNNGNNCDIKSPTEVGGIQSFVLRIVLNVIEIMLQIVGYVCVGFIIYGGFIYMTSQGEAGKMAGAKSSILNAVIGLVISIGSVAIVQLITRGPVG